MDTCVCALTKPAVANLSVPSITFSALNVSGIFSTAKISLSLIAISAIFTLPSANKTLAFFIKIFIFKPLNYAFAKYAFCSSVNSSSSTPRAFNLI